MANERKFPEPVWVTEGNERQKGHIAVFPTLGSRLKRANRDVLDQMRQAARDAWVTVEHRLGDRDRELREQQK
jgi:hypothetical protein